MRVKAVLFPSRSTVWELRLEGALVAYTIAQTVWLWFDLSARATAAQVGTVAGFSLLGVVLVMRPPNIASATLRRWFFLALLLCVIVVPIVLIMVSLLVF